MAGCNQDGQSNEINPLALLGTYGPYTLTVNVTYDGAAATDGTGKIYVYLFDELGLTSRNPIYSGSTDAAYAGGVASINVEHIKAGDYYVLVFFDYVGGDNPDNRYDRYTLYGGAGPVGFAGSAVAYAVTGDATIGGTIDFGDSYQFQSQSRYMLPCTLTVNATYNGTDFNSAVEPGTGRLFVYLYDSLGTDTRTPTPLWAGSTATAATIGVETPIVLTNIPAGSYKAVLFYDYSEEAGHNDSEGDRYVLYNSKQYTSLADTITISDGGSATWTASFGNSYTLQTDGAYMTPSSPVTYTVNATYTGAVTPDASATGKFHVYLYDALGRGTRLPDAPNFYNSSLTAGTTGTVSITGIIPGAYYVAVFYDCSYSATNVDSPGDKYLLSGNTQYPGSAFPVDITSNMSANISIGDSYSFQGNVLSNALFMQTGSLTVTATYTGSEPSSNIGSKKIYVYLYDSLNASGATTGGTRDPLPIYTGSTTGAVTVSTPADITITDILPGSYYMVVFYDFRSGTNPDNQTDRYVIYNTIEFPISGATIVPISAGSNSVTGISFGDGFQLSSGGVFN